MNEPRFRKDADLLLGSLTWTRADANKVLSAVKGEEPKMKRKLSLGLVLVIALALLAAVALAIGLTYSPGYAAVQTARKAVMEKYGLTSDMLRLYIESIKAENGATTVLFQGAGSEFLKEEPMGDYTATVDGRGNAVAAWTHDGADASALEKGDLTSAGWGPRQLQMALDRYQTYQQWCQETPALYLLPVAEQAERMAALDAAIAPCHVSMTRTETPEASDLPEEEALALARQAVQDTYHAEINDQWTTARYFQREDAQYPYGRCYSFTFQRSVEDGAPYETHQVWVRSPSGQAITEKDALAEKLAANASPEVGGTDTPDATDGSSALIASDMPAPGTVLTEKTALAAAKQVLFDWYHLTDDMLDLFITVPSLNTTDGDAVWTVAFLSVEDRVVPRGGQAPALSTDWRWDNDLASKLGSYIVWLDGETGEMRQAWWSLDGMENTAAYTENNWANAKVYDAHILPWLVKLLRQNAPIIAKYPDDQHDWFTVEDAAAYDQAFRDAGFDAERYAHGLPKETDLTADQALLLACQAMQNEYGLTREQIDAATLTTEYLLTGGGEWSVGFYTAEGMGSVRMNAATGEIQRMYLDSAASGIG